MTEFDRFASSYKEILDRSLARVGESSGYFAAYKAAYIARLLRDQPGPLNILDFGCGVGVLADALAALRPGDRIDGYDVSRQSIEQVDPQRRSAGVFTDSIGDLSDRYDLIVLSNVMHHVPPAARADMIGTVASLLGPGGRALVIEHNPSNPLTRRVVAGCQFDEDAILLRPSEVKDLFRQAGLVPERLDYVVFFPRFLAPLRLLERFLGWCPAGAQYATLARKAALAPADRPG